MFFACWMNVCTHPLILGPCCGSSQFQCCKEPYLCCGGGRKPSATRWFLNLSSILADPDCLNPLWLAELFKHLSTKKKTTKKPNKIPNKQTNKQNPDKTKQTRKQPKSNLFWLCISSALWRPMCMVWDTWWATYPGPSQPLGSSLGCYPAASVSKVKTSGPQAQDMAKLWTQEYGALSCSIFLEGVQKLVMMETWKPSTSAQASSPTPVSGPACLHSWRKSRNLLRKTTQSSPCSLLLQITFQQKMIFTFLVTNEKPFNSVCWH